MAYIQMFNDMNTLLTMMAAGTQSYLQNVISALSPLTYRSIR